MIILTYYFWLGKVEPMLLELITGNYQNVINVHKYMKNLNMVFSLAIVGSIFSISDHEFL